MLFGYILTKIVYTIDRTSSIWIWILSEKHGQLDGNVVARKVEPVLNVNAGLQI